MDGKKQAKDNIGTYDTVRQGIFESYKFHGLCCYHLIHDNQMQKYTSMLCCVCSKIHENQFHGNYKSKAFLVN